MNNNYNYIRRGRPKKYNKYVSYLTFYRGRFILKFD